MQTLYLAYGLQVRSGFALPGMTPERAGGLPSLSLRLESVEGLSRRWSGSPGEPTWRGTLGDGVSLTMEDGAEGDVLFSYGDRARFHLDASVETLSCVPLQDGLDWQRTLLSKVLAAVSVIRGYESLHAAVMDSPQGAVAIAAPAGAGKSTLALELLRRGWPLMADDALVLESTEAGVRAHPGTPHMNLAVNLPDGVAPETLGDTLGFLAGERWLAAHNVARQPRPVRMVCLLERGAGLTLHSSTLPVNPLALAPYMLGMAGDEQRQRDRFCLYADLIEAAPLVRLTAGPQHGPGQIADALESALHGHRQPLAGALA
jgi:hypothetical protein